MLSQSPTPDPENRLLSFVACFLGGASEGNGEATGLLSFSLCQTTVAKLNLPSPEHPRPQRVTLAY